MATYLDDIIAFHRERARLDTRSSHERLQVIEAREPIFASAIRSNPNVSVIAEIKRRSPSKGLLAPGLNPVELAGRYENSGATCISVLTDEQHFGGSLDDLRIVRANTSLPLLRKDFTVSANDVLDAFDAGATAVLLIVAALSDDELSDFYTLATSIGLDVLVECHDDEEVSRALLLDPVIVGINQRNLHTFEVDTDHAVRVAAKIPNDVLIVAESGLRSRADVERMAEAGFSAVLVGETFVTSTNPAELVRSFCNVEKR
jgi:indole-3-glycerol phosphate synthase